MNTFALVILALGSFALSSWELHDTGKYSGLLIIIGLAASIAAIAFSI